ncbi:hypothetical protein F5B22DRAFT_566461 [Xylaria bambusicola]|uniref:uncharacterized protein n=1 Tax=Xylaria bambusicola TaxID=326684 RepID=UPI002008CDE3|nr:uncharacterized protein F5B22DRAFT_566461 [Xylaria bambusicola]KAI0521228.1 hypothetical protein F5B22DRAFT_566461 [Xylaria bambusicola]
MKFLLTMTIAHLGVIWALPSQSYSQSYVPCPDGLYDTPNCCSKGLLGDWIDCTTPVMRITSAIDFQNQCAVVGKVAACCVRPLIGTSVIFCTNPVGLGPFGYK